MDSNTIKHIVVNKAFKDKLDQDKELENKVGKAILTMNKIYSGELLFFPGYTDHGHDHIQAVINSSIRLIPQDTLDNILKPFDIGLLITSILLHDIGMHLSYDGFKQLINGNFDHLRCEKFDLLTWKELWDEYIDEAKKFNSKQLKAIFGKENATIEMPEENLRELNQVLLIGEFIRRHHARLAHEIAKYGMPGVENDTIDVLEGFIDDDRNLIGVIARSHGIEIRETYDYIKGITHKQSFKYPLTSRAFYLMTVLRISDYLQISKKRTNDLTLKLKSLASPISTNEWKTHFAIVGIQDFGLEDDEMLLVIAYPKSSFIYLKLKKLIMDIQMELDTCWAILGEIYGATEDNERPKLKFRRITSNINEIEYTSHQNYIPDKFVFDADPDIVKILVAPLYGNKPRYGIRELIQNAVDACNEMEFLSKDLPMSSNYKGSVKIEVDVINNNYYFNIIDNGKGMTTDEIKNYFLRSAASYRKSLGWKRVYVNSDGETSLQKAGRFGIGVLAAFLLGEEIEVWTKHYQLEDNKGHYFKCKIDDENIEVIKHNNIHEVGTKIRIKLTKDIFDFLIHRDNLINNYKWFSMGRPIVTFSLNGKAYIPYKTFDPTFDEPLKPDWYCFSNQDFKKIVWTYDCSLNKSTFKLNCNGINVCRNYKFEDNLLKTPRVIVFDFEGKLPLTIDRNKIDEEPSFSDLLRDEIYKRLIARILNYDAIKNDFFVDRSLGSEHRESDYEASVSDIIKNKRGFLLNYEYFLSRINLHYDKVIFLKLYQIQNIDASYLSDDFLISQSKIAVGHKRVKSNPSDIVFWKDYTRDWRIESSEFTGKMDIDDDKDKERIMALLTDSDLLALFKRYRPFMEGMSMFKDLPMPSSNHKTLNTYLEKYLGEDPFIPHDYTERRTKFAKAFDELKDYM